MHLLARTALLVLLFTTLSLSTPHPDPHLPSPSVLLSNLPLQFKFPDTLPTETETSSSPRIHSISYPPYALLTVNGFGMYKSNWTDPKTPALHNTDTVSFRVRDTRPDYPADVHCVLPSIRDMQAYDEKYTTCGHTFPYPFVAFKLSEGEIRILRGWRESPTMYWVGIAEAGTYWKSEKDIVPGSGICPNKTSMPAGEFMARAQEWPVPIHTIMSSSSYSMEGVLGEMGLVD